MKKIDLEHFEKKIRVRQLRKDDYNDIVQLQKMCFPGMIPWTKDEIESQIDNFPEGQLCVEVDGKVIASSASLIIDFDLYGEKHDWMKVSGGGKIANHNPDGDTLYGIEIMVHPDYRGMKLARRIYDARKMLVRELNLMRMVAGGRIPQYKRYRDEMSPEEYVERVKNKALFDPVLTTQLANGFQVKRILRDYLDEDEASYGFATLLEWMNLYYQPEPRKHYRSSSPVRICAVQYLMRKINNFAEFASQVEYFVDVASDYKSDFVLFPEIFTTQLLSFMDEKRPGLAARKLAEYTPQYLELFTGLAMKYNINIIGGSTFVQEEEKLYNVAYLFKRNGEIGKQYKLHVTPNERMWWGVSPGNEVNVFETDVGKISMQICYDVEFPEVSRIAVEKGAQIVFVPFCTDERHGYLRVRYCSQARCIENHIYAAIAGTVGNMPHVENMDIQYAQSAILTPSDFEFSRDAVGAECMPNIETVVIHDVDLDILKRHRKDGTTRNWMDRRTDLYELKIRQK